MIGSQLELFNRFERLRLREFIPIYKELEASKKPGRRSILSECDRIQEILGEYWMHDCGPWQLETELFGALKLANPQIKDSTLNRYNTRFTRIFSAAYKWRRLGTVGPYDFSALLLPMENPGSLVKKFSETKYRRNLVITPQQFAKFIDYAHPNVRRICTVAVLTLLRRKDIQLLTDENLNAALDTLSGVQSKTGLPYNVPAPITVRIIFNEARIEQREYICDFTNFRRLFTRAVRDSGIRFLFMDLRRTGATQLLLEGIDLMTIMKYLGHGSLTMTQGYLAPPTQVSKVAGRKLEAAFITRVEIPVENFSQN